jgi:hypothetical protein
MIESEIVVTTKHGRMPTFMAAPDGPGQHPGIIFYMDAPGIREELRNMARHSPHGYPARGILTDWAGATDIPRREMGCRGYPRVDEQPVDPVRERRHRSERGSINDHRVKPGPVVASRLHERALHHLGSGGVPAPRGGGRLCMVCRSSPTRIFAAPDGGPDQGELYCACRT